MLYVLAAILLVSLAFSATATQTDWSGGGGVPGPISEWGNSFYTSLAVDPVGSTLRLENLLLPTPITNTVTGDFESVYSVFAEDVDGDGDADIIGAGFWNDNISWWENDDGSGTSWIKHTMDNNFNGACSVYAIDIDSDGDMDVLGAARLGSEISWWENMGVDGQIVWVKHIIDNDFWTANSVFAEDVDGDGDMDVLGAGIYADEIVWWENVTGVGTVWDKRTIDGNFNGAFYVYATDVDKDGWIDVLGAGRLCGDITWWRNIDGTGTVWTEYTVDEAFNDPYSVFASDMDNDGDIDILGAGGNSDMIAWWENTNSIGTSWTEHLVCEGFQAAYSVHAADIDGDGDEDVIGAAHYDDEITWWENEDGTGIVWIEHKLDTDFDGAYSVYASDINGDGCVDILGAASIAADIVWWDVVGHVNEGILESSILDAGDIGEWNIFLSSSQKPTGTSVSFQFRSSDDSSSMGAWSDTVYSPDTPLEGILADSTRYLQYKVILETSDPTISPELFEVAFSYTLLVGTAESESAEVPSWSLRASENPSHGFFSALISVPDVALVELALYDVSGRMVAEASQEFPAGTHSVNFSGLVEGVYFCTMRTAEFTATERIVVLE